MMRNYAIGDIQGCLQPLLGLLQHIEFNFEQDQLWLTGDLINRGPQSLEVLRFLKVLPKPARIVLGNHDLHFLAVAYGFSATKKHDTLRAILQAPDCMMLCEWLRQQPLLYHDAALNYTMVHAGIWPFWSLAQAQEYAAEVEALLRNDDYHLLLSELYGNTPNNWDENLTGIARWRFIVNSFTRMRFCDAQGNLELTIKTAPGTQPAGYSPWFAIPNRLMQDQKIIFGHWAALEGKTDNPNVFAIDSGCVWGRCLTALRLEDGKQFSVRC